MSHSRPSDAKRKIYVECTYTFFAGGNSGIRRVVRNIANFGPEVSPPDAEIRPIVWGGVSFFSPAGRRLGEESHLLFRLLRIARSLNGRIIGLATRSISFLARPLPEGVRTRLRNLWKRILAPLRTGGDFELLYYLLGLFSSPLGLLLGRGVNFEPGDAVVLVDSTWNSRAMREYLIRARSDKQIHLGVMIHDLFPLSLPETCEQETIDGFTTWFTHIVAHVDFIITASQSTQSAVQAHIQQNPELRPYQYRAGTFTPGADLDLRQDYEASEQSQAIWDCPGTAILSLGTIEPRKNHQFLLDAFDILIARGCPVSLIIVGRYGWKSDDILERIESHPALGTQLVHLSAASDADLHQTFSRSDCMVCCSLAEGFGLPVVEGLMHGLTVFASDIPVFREVGGDFCRYFALDDPEELAALLENWVAAYQRGEQRAEPQTWLDWKESTRQFGETVQQLLPSY